MSSDEKVKEFPCSGCRGSLVEESSDMERRPIIMGRNRKPHLRGMVVNVMTPSYDRLLDACNENPMRLTISGFDFVFLCSRERISLH